MRFPEAIEPMHITSSGSHTAIPRDHTAWDAKCRQRSNNLSIVTQMCFMRIADGLRVNITAGQEKGRGKHYSSNGRGSLSAL